jgi:hypothetical protein
MPKLTLLVLCSLLLTLRAARTGDRFDLQVINVPGATNFRVVALNEKGTVLGMAMITNTWHTFLWRDSVTTFLDVGGDTFVVPYGMNNLDEVVGSMATNGYYRPWLYSGGTNYIVGPEPSAQQYDNAARAINDDGVVVGNVGMDGYVFRPREIRFPAMGGGPCWSGFSKLTAIDNTGVVLGEFDRVSVRFPSWQTPASWERPDAYEYQIMTAIALRGSKIVGSFYGAPALKNGANLVTLSAPRGAGKVVAINDAGVMVGEDGERNALVWTGTHGTRLGTLTHIPTGTRLISPCGVNNAGEIAALLVGVDDNTTAVLLRPKQSPLTIPTPAIGVPAKALFDTNNLTISLQFSLTVPIANVAYTLFLRQVEPSHGTPPCGWFPASTNLAVLTTNVTVQAPFTLVLTNISPGQYAYQAAVQDERGAVTYSLLGYFGVSGKPSLRIQRSWLNEVEIALDGQAGLLDVLEVSSNLVDWLEVTNVPPNSGTTLLETTNQWASVSQKYYRARVVAQDVDAFGYRPLLTETPVFPSELTGVTLRLVYNDGTINDLAFATANTGSWTIFGGQGWPFNYQWKPALRTLDVQADDWGSNILLTPNRPLPMPDYPSTWRNGNFQDEFLQGGVHETLLGYYFVLQ